MGTSLGGPAILSALFPDEAYHAGREGGGGGRGGGEGGEEWGRDGSREGVEKGVGGEEG